MIADLFGDLWSFMAVAAVIIVMPGADMALVTRITLADGTTGGLKAVLGILLGLCVHAGAAMVGLSAVIAASAIAFEVVKYVGAAYLIVLGIQTLLSSSSRAVPGPRSDKPPLPGTVVRGPLMQGLLTNVLNPKLVIFFLSFVPQFVSDGPHGAARIAFLSAVFVVMGGAWLVCYVTALNALSEVMAKPNVRRWIDRVAGGVLCAVGLRLSLS